MRKKSFLYIAILATALGGNFQSYALSAQTSASGNTQPLQFKFARLGMSLEEFKRATARGDVTVSVPGRFATHYKKVPSPVCTDNLVGFAVDGFANLQEGSVMCDPSVTGDRINPEDEYLTIGGSSADQIHYFFYQGKLYSIEILANHYAFGTILDAFETKYGPDNRRTIDVFQNGLGGRWRGTNYFWDRGTQSISVFEGNGGGPLNNFIPQPSTAVIKDSSLAPPEAPTKPSNI
jgi:hypothetical protein